MIYVSANVLSFGLFWLSALIFLVFSLVKVVDIEKPEMVSELIIPLLIYGLAHALRAIRLRVLLGTGRLRHLLVLYLYTAACSAVFPFKLGELVRVNEIARWSGSFWRGLLVVWIERVFDVMPLALMAYFILNNGVQGFKDIGFLLWAMGGFILLTVLIFFIMPEQLRGLNLYIIRNYKGQPAVKFLKAIDSIYLLFDQVRPLIADKLVTLALFTCFIWGAELLAVSMLFGVNPWQNAVTSLVLQFSQVLGDSSKATNLTSDFDEIKILFLILLGLVSLIFYGRWYKIQKDKY